MKRVLLSRYQRGYLYEIPAALLALLLVLALTVPHLPVFWQKVLLGVATPAILYLLFYLIVRPGRTVAAAHHSYASGRVALFLACAVLATVSLAAFILR